jgi:hypothetical protein
LGLQTGGDSAVAARSCDGGVVLEASLEGGGGGGGHTTDLVAGESQSASLAPVHDARALMGRPHGPIRIHAVCLYVDLLGGDSGTDMTSTSSSSSSSSAMVTLTTPTIAVTTSSPSLGLDDDNTVHLSATK